MANPALGSDLKLIDTDTHVIEPPDLWTSRVPRKWVDRVPQVKFCEPAQEPRWLIGDRWSTSPGYYALAGWPDYYPSRPVEYDEIDLGGWQSGARLERMDEYGIYAQVLYPNLIGFDTTSFIELGPEIAIACTQAYNDFLVEFASADPDRLVPIAMVPFWDLDAAVKEIHRAKETGHRGVLFANRYERIGLPSFVDPYWDPVYTSLQDLGLSVNFHIGFSRPDTMLNDPSRLKSAGAEGQPEKAKMTPEDFSRWVVRKSTETMLGNAETIRELLTSDLCDRFPSLKFVSVESGFGYVPYLLEALDWQWKAHGAFRYLSTAPSEYFRRQCYGSFWFEEKTLRLLDLYPDNFMFETDYPHPTSLSPGPASPADIPINHVRSVFADFDHELTRKVLHDNAASIYGLK